ncbi:MAG: SDR family oxidoreductase [Cytophagales bacterium]|nr:MAG: SDR family oxidoreductase [Cytophagales bacterium]
MPSILILGATSDIAQAVANKFASQNYDLILAGRNLNELERIQKDLIIRYKVSISIAEFEALALEKHEDFVAQFNPLPEITACVFGYLGDQEKAQKEWNEAAQIIHINFTAAISILSVIANKYEAQKYGCIIGISSVAGERGRQSNYFYGSAKAGFSIFLDGLRNRLFKSNVHVITVKPGFVDTKMTFGLPLPKPLTAKPHHLGDAIYKAYLSKTNTLYVLWMWKWIMLIIRLIPENIFKKMKL